MNTYLVTRAQFDAAASSLDRVRQLLDSHAATPWSAVHGVWRLESHDYTNSYSQLVASTVAVFEVGGVKYYVPAKDATAASADADPAVGPVDALCVWKHEDATGAPRLDSAGNLRHLAVVGTVTTAAGKFGLCSQLNGSSRLLVKSDDQLTFKRGATLTCWVKFSTLVDGAVVWSKAATAGSIELAVRVKLDGSDYKLSLYTGLTELPHMTILSAGAWYFVAVTYDRFGSQLALRVNASTVTGYGAVVDVPESPYLSLGAFSQGASPLTGFIDSTRFFTRTLTTAELDLLYGAGAGLPAVSVPQNTTGVGTTNPAVNRPTPELNRLISATTDFDRLQASAAALDLTLRSHIAQDFPAVHGGLTVLSRLTRDSAGYVVGRYLLVMTVAGRQYGLVADTRPDGPPKLVKLATPCPTALFVGASGVSCSLVGCRFRVISNGGGSGEKFPSEIEFTFNLVAGTGSIKYTWQWSEDGVNWKDVALPNGAVVRGAGIVPLQDSYGNWGHVGEIQTAPVAAFKTLWRSQSPGGDRGSGWSMRVKFDNTHVGGGVTYSGTLDCYLQDHSDSHLCSAALQLGWIEPETYLADLRHARTMPAEFLVGYRRWSRPLSRWVRRNAHSWPARLVLWLTCRWCQHAAFEVGQVPHDSAVGRWLKRLGDPVCRWLGRR